jgi:hypothetical protein
MLTEKDIREVPLKKRKLTYKELCQAILGEDSFTF